jgi:hypothetical protein
MTGAHREDCLCALWFYYSQTRFKLFSFPIFRFWAYQMKVIQETRQEHQIRYLRIYVLQGFEINMLDT